MKLSFPSQIKKWCAGLALLSFFAAAVFSIGIGMNMDEKGNMAPCAFMAGETVVCPMGVSQHLDEWAGLFAPISSALVFLIIVGLFLPLVFLSLFPREGARSEKMRLYALNNFHLKSLHFLALLFSRGILNSRRYKFAII